METLSCKAIFFSSYSSVRHSSQKKKKKNHSPPISTLGWFSQADAQAYTQTPPLYTRKEINKTKFPKARALNEPN